MFSFTPRDSKCKARTGEFSLKRHDGSSLSRRTPSFLTSTSRGVIPHLSRDHYTDTKAIAWINVPFETFLEHPIPVPTLQQGEYPYHTFLGYNPQQHLVSLSLRDPYEIRDMPPNGNDFVNALTMRGVRKMNPSTWNELAAKLKPDIVFALSDTPYTPPPHSQKRVTKNIERSAAWLVELLKPALPSSVFVHLAGGIIHPARAQFAKTLTEPLYGREANILPHLKTLDEGVAGYVVDLMPLKAALSNSDTIPALIQTSLDELSPNKIRLVNSTTSPHEVLQYIRHNGVDLFDADWVQKAANFGIALNFSFPIPPTFNAHSPGVRGQGKLRDIGHNLFESVFANDFTPLSDGSMGCVCKACSPLSVEKFVLHSQLDSQSYRSPTATPPPLTRAYIHHLLHTHEMSSHSLLVMHNLAVLDSFFTGIRHVLDEDPSGALFEREVDKFEAAYDRDLALFVEARTYWSDVELARGKGRLKREKEKQAAVVADLE